MLWGAFNNASSAMMTMSGSMGAISQNIANLNTTGYKNKEVLFQTVMSESKGIGNPGGGGRVNIFGVQGADRTHIASQGVVTPSNFWSDLAINGEGFFLVAPPTGSANGVARPPATASPDSADQVLYTRDGGFRFQASPTGENYFMTGSGHYLLGWMADDTGAIAPGAPLEPVYTLPNTLMTGRATTNGNIRANLPASSAMTPTTYQKSAEISDANGNAQQVSFNWTRTGGNTWSVQATSPAFATNPPAWNVTMDGWGKISAPTDTNPMTTINWLPANGGSAAQNVNFGSTKPSPHMQKIHMSVYDSAYNKQDVTFGFERAGTNTWYLHVDQGVNGTPGTNPAPVQLTFDENGKMLTPASGTLPLSFNFTVNSQPTTGAMTLDIGKVSQYDGDLYLGGVDQDGYGDGTLMKQGFNDKGELTGLFTNGETRILFKVPVAQFTSQNRLDPISGNLFRRTKEAGDVTVSAAENASGEPRFATSALESSTVDIGDEFTKMIVTQKAYSTNATVFRTADEMTMTARDLKA